MNIENANSEPYRVYHDFHEELNARIKILTASVVHTCRMLREPGSAHTLGSLIRSADPAWKFAPRENLDGEIERLMVGSVGNLGIITVWSALDDLVSGVAAERVRFAAFSRAPISQTSRGARGAGNDSRVVTFIAQCGWEGLVDCSYLAILKYFGFIRNCIAHRRALASEALVSYCAEEELVEAFGAMKNKKHGPYSFSVDEEIRVLPKDVLFYSHVVRLVAERMNERLVNELGRDGLLNMTVAHASTYERPVLRGPRTLEALLNFLLTERYLIRVDNDWEAPRRLRELGIWEIFSRSNPEPSRYFV